MKKGLKIGGIALAALAGIAILLGAFLFLNRPSDVVVMTPAQTKKEEKKEARRLAGVDLSGFQTVSVDGKAVSAADCFQNYKVTMVNIWTTDCEPCISEMPEIAKLYRNRPKDSNIISICLDLKKGSKDVSFAAKVMKDAKAKFTTLIPDRTLNDALQEPVIAYPTTIFVDSAGKVVGAPHFGGRTASDYRQAILDRMKLADAAGQAAKR